MPSFRVILTIGALRPGIRPDRVLPELRAAVAELTTVEAGDVGIVAGEARVTIRFTADDADAARGVGARVAERAADLADVQRRRITVRDGSRWLVVPGS